MPQMEFADYVPQIVWLVVAFATLYFLMSQLALPRITDILETRQRRLDHDLELTEKLRDEATAALAEYESAVAEARGKSELILAEARESIHSETRQRLDDLNARFAGSVPFLMGFARVLGGHAHLMAAMADPEGPRARLARFYITRLLPQHAGHLAHARAGAEDLYAVSPDDLAA